MECLQAINYFHDMPETLEQRLDEIEKRVAELGAIVGAAPRRKDWLATVGTWPEDEISRDAERLGQEYREQVNRSGDCAGT